MDVPNSTPIYPSSVDEQTQLLTLDSKKLTCCFKKIHTDIEFFNTFDDFADACCVLFGDMASVEGLSHGSPPTKRSAK